MKKTYNKLIRDRIPQIIETSGNSCTTRVLDAQEYVRFLTEKLKEEVSEYLDDPSLEELADIMEVVLALAETHGADAQRLEEIRISKQEKRGGFSKRLFLETVEEHDQQDP